MVVESNVLGPNAAGDLFQILRDGAPRTRTELAAITGLARSTIALRIDTLMRVGLVRSVDEAASTGGRPSTQFALDVDGRVVFAVDLGASHARVAMSDLTGRILAEERADLPVASGPDRVVDWVCEAAERLRTNGGRAPEDVMAMGVGVPAPVEHEQGRLYNPPIMPGWDRFDVAGSFRDRLGVPVLVDNDVNIMALGEHERSWPDVDHLLFVKVATGIGSGIISSGRLQRGAQGTAGDLGHVFLARGADVPCTCGNRGCLEAIASGPAIARSLRGQGIDAASSQDVVDLVRQGNVDAIQAVRQAGRDIGEVLSTCVNLLNPSVIVLGGAMAQAGEHLLAGVRELVYTRSMPLATERLRIDQSRSGADAAVIGAAMLAIHHALSPERIDELVELVV